MALSKRLYRIKKFEPMWMSRQELKDTYNRDIFQFINISGRLGGKSYNTFQLIGITSAQFPTHDVVVLRANSSQLKQSVFTEMKKWYMDVLPYETFAKIDFRGSPPLMITMPAGNQIMFGGVGLGSKSGSNQSRGKTTERKISLIIIEETQEIFSGSADGEELLKQAIATYIRYLDDEIGKIVYLGNRDRNLNGKFNVWCREKLKDDTFLTIETNYHDIESLLNEATLRMIQQEKELNPKNYQYMYMGNPIGGNDLVYSGFVQDIHIMPNKGENKDVFVQRSNRKEYSFTKENLRSQLMRVYIGVDGSTVNDLTCLIPIFNFRDTKLIVKSSDIFQHNPRMNGQIMNNVLVDKYVRKWLQNLITRYGLEYIEKVFVVDAHNNDLIMQLKYQFGGYCKIIAFGRKDLIETTNKVNNAFADEKLLITDESWYEIVSNHAIAPSTLYGELETVCWREDDASKFNDSIPNDRTDAIRYPVAYHATPYQLNDFGKGSE
jgi:phage terminase large subunit